jgi:hypothetical protein
MKSTQSNSLHSKSSFASCPIPATKFPEYPDSQRIKTDIDTIAESRKRLIPLRHKVYAHKDLETVLSEKREEFLSSHDEVKRLILLAHELWNHYSNIWNASLYLDKIHGEDDYKLLFSYLRHGMKTNQAQDRSRDEREDA